MSILMKWLRASMSRRADQIYESVVKSETAPKEFEESLEKVERLLGEENRELFLEMEERLGIMMYIVYDAVYQAGVKDGMVLCREFDRISSQMDEGTLDRD